MKLGEKKLLKTFKFETSQGTVVTDYFYNRNATTGVYYETQESYMMIGGNKHEVELSRTGQTKENPHGIKIVVIKPKTADALGVNYDKNGGRICMKCDWTPVNDFERKLRQKQAGDIEEAFETYRHHSDE